MDQDLANELKRLRDERQKKFEQEDWEGALAIHDKILELSPSALRYANRASILFRLGRLEDAIGSYRKALEMDPSLTRARADLERVEAQLAATKSEKSVSSAMPVASLSDDEKQKKIAELRQSREKKLELKDWQGALHAHNQILDLEPTALRYANQGSILYRMGKLKEAIAAYKKALEMDPTLEKVKVDMAKLQSQMEEEQLLGNPQAKEQTMEDEDIQGKIEKLRKKRQEKIDKGEWNQALELQNEILNLEPTALRYTNRASLLCRLGKFEEAIADYQKALQMDPSLDRAKEDLARLEAEMEEKSLLPAATVEPEPAAAAKVPDMSPEEREAKIAKLREERQKYLDAKDWKKALELHDQLLVFEPTALRYVNRGSLYYRMGDLEKAIADYRHALELEPNLGRAKQDLARMEEELAKNKIAGPAKEEKKMPQEELAQKLEEYRIKRQEMMDKGNWNEALVFQDQIIALEPNALRYANRGSILYRLGRIEEAIFTYRKALDMDSSLDRAKEDLDRIKDTEMERLRQLRQEMMDKENWDKALEAHNVILALEPTPLRYANRGSMLYRMKRLNDARQDYLKALELEPSLDQAKNDLAEIEKELKQHPTTPVDAAIPAELVEDDEEGLGGAELLATIEKQTASETPREEPQDKAAPPSAIEKRSFCTATITAHEGEISDLAATSDGKFIISAGKDNTCKIWDAKSTKCVHTLKGHQDWIRAIEINCKEEKIITASDDWTVKVWDIGSGKCEYTLSGHSMPVLSLAVSKNERVFSSSRDHTIKIWDLKNGKQITTLEGHRDWVHCIAVVPEGDKIISGSYDSTIRVWNVLGWRCTHTLQGHEGSIEKLLLSSEGKYIISAGKDRTIRVWEIAGGKSVATLTGHQEPISDIYTSPDGKLLASCGRDNAVYLWEIPQGKPRATLEGGGTTRFTKVAITPNNRFVLAASIDNRIRVWDLENNKLAAVWEEHTSPVHTLLFIPKTSLVVSGSQDGFMKIWDYSLLTK